MRKHTILCLMLCLMLLSGCGRLPTQEEPGAGNSSGTPTESSAVQQEEPTEPNPPAGSSFVAAPEPSAPQDGEPSAPNAGESVTAGESGTEPDPDVVDREPEISGEAQHWLTVGRDTAHSSPYAFTVPEDGVYTFQFLGENTARLNVYVLEDAFEDGVRYLPQAYQPAALSADRAIPLKAGYWVYCFSSTDVFAAGAQSGVSSVLTVDYTAGTVEQGTVSQPW